MNLGILKFGLTALLNQDKPVIRHGNPLPQGDTPPQRDHSPHRAQHPNRRDDRAGNEESVSHPHDSNPSRQEADKNRKDQIPLTQGAAHEHVH
ncbi:MAG: hypothetical protein ACK55I_38140, partial [bacterium]